MAQGDLFQPLLGDAGVVTTSSVPKPADNTAAFAVDRLNNLANTFLRTEAANAPGNLTEADKQRAFREDFDFALSRAIQSGDRAKVNAIIRRGGVIFGANDPGYIQTVQTYTGITPVENINPVAAEFERLKKMMEAEPLLAVAATVYQEGTNIPDVPATLENFKALISVDATNLATLRLNQAKALDKWLREDQPKVEAYVAQLGANIRSIVDNLKNSPLDVESLSQMKSQLLAKRAELEGVLPASLPKEEKDRLTNIFSSLEKSLDAVMSREDLLKVGNEAARNQVFSTFVNAVQDPQLRSTILLLGADHMDILMQQALLNTFADAQKTKSLMSALEDAAKNTPVFSTQATPGLFGPSNTTTAPQISPSQMSLSDLIATPTLQKALNIPETERYTTAKDNARTFAELAPSVVGTPEGQKTALSLLAQTFILMDQKSGFNFVPKLSEIFSDQFLNNYREFLKKSPENASLISALATKSLDTERSKHTLALEALQEKYPNIFVGEDGRLKIAQVLGDELSKFVADSLANPEEARARGIDVDALLANLKAMKDPRDLEDWLKENPQSTVEWIFSELGISSVLGVDVRGAFTQMKKHMDAITYLDSLRKSLPKPPDAPPVVVSTDPKIDRIARGILPLIDKREGAGNYNAYYQNANQSDVKFTEMTVDQVIQYQRDNPIRITSGPNRGRTSSAVGRYQIVGTTLRSLKRELGLTGKEIFSPELQDQLFLALVKRRIKKGNTARQNMNALRAEWEGLKSVPDEQLLSLL